MFRRALILLLGLSFPLIALAQSGVVMGGKSVVGGSAVMTSASDPYAGYQFFQTMNSAIPEKTGNTPMPPGTTPTLFNSTVSGGTLNLTAVSFSEMLYFGNASNSAGFATIDEGTMEADFQFVGNLVNGAFLFQIDGAAGSGNPFDTEDANNFSGRPATNSIAGVYIGNNGLTIVRTADIVMANPSTGTHHIVKRWKRSSSTTTQSVQIDRDPPGNYSAPLPATLAGEWHSYRPGNDTTNPLQFKMFNVGLKETAGPYSMNGEFWQDFEISGTIDATSLSAHDHNGTLTWSTSASISSFSVTSGAQYTSPSLINYMTDTGALGLERDINATAPQWIAVQFATFETLSTANTWIRNSPTLTSGTEIMDCFVAANSSNYNLIIVLKNEGGQHKIRLRNRAGTESTGAINYTPGTDLNVVFHYARSDTCTLNMFDSSGSSMGTQITVAGPAADGLMLFFGSLDTNTSQAPGTKLRNDNLVIDVNLTLPAPVTSDLFKPFQ